MPQTPVSTIDFSAVYGNDYDISDKNGDHLINPNETITAKHDIVGYKAGAVIAVEDRSYLFQKLQEKISSIWSSSGENSDMGVAIPLYMSPEAETIFNDPNNHIAVGMGNRAIGHLNSNGTIGNWSTERPLIQVDLRSKEVRITVDANNHLVLKVKNNDNTTDTLVIDPKTGEEFPEAKKK